MAPASGLPDSSANNHTCVAKVSNVVWLPAAVLPNDLRVPLASTQNVSMAPEVLLSSVIHVGVPPVWRVRRASSGETSGSCLSGEESDVMLESRVFKIQMERWQKTRRQSFVPEDSIRRMGSFSASHRMPVALANDAATAAWSKAGVFFPVAVSTWRNDQPPDPLLLR